VFAKGNFAAISSVVHGHCAYCDQAPQVATLICMKTQRACRTGDVLDGTSNTVAFSEVLVSPVDRDSRGAWAHPANMIATFNWLSFFPTTLWLTDLIMLPNADTQSGAVGGYYHRDRIAWCQSPSPTDRQLACYEFRDSWETRAAPRSRHPGGVNAAYADGSIRFLPDTVDPFVYWHVLAIGDGEAVPLP
jgi:prepilin-type processing-associated H-X9-DG protein